MDLIEDVEYVTVDSVLNWILLLAIFSFITVIGNYIGYNHPIGKSLVGMFILSVLTLIGMVLERVIPLNISSLIYISLLGLILAIPIMPTSKFIVYYVSNVELLAIVTVFLAYVGIAIGKNWGQFKAIGWRGIIVTISVITGTFVGSALIAHVILVLSGVSV